MVKDEQIGECFRLDHLIKAHLENVITSYDLVSQLTDKDTADEIRLECEDLVRKLDDMTKEEMSAVLRRFEIKSPFSGNDLSDPVEFNLMFGTSIGPTGSVKGYLRPETAQGIFVNFKRLLEFNHVIILTQKL
jgi:glycyl-tRNA synthetase